jgi:hypothetical protein
MPETRNRVIDFVGPPRRFVHSAAFRLLAMDVADEAIVVQNVSFAANRYVGPTRCVAPVEQALLQTTLFIGSGVCGRPSADEAETAIIETWF